MSKKSKPDAGQEEAQDVAEAAAAEVVDQVDAAEVTAAPEGEDGAEVDEKAETIARLKALIADIQERNNPSHHLALVADLQANEGAVIEDKVTHWRVKMAGLETTCTAGRSLALANWAAKARRQLLKLEDA